MTSFETIREFLINAYGYFGLAECLVIGLTTLYAAVGYQGKARENYSALNHYISELGEVGVSPRAKVFNSGLIAGGVILIPFVSGLGFTLNNIWGWLGIAGGIWTAISIIFVGIYSMDNIEPHIKAANSYFWSGLVTVVLFTLGIFLQAANPAPIDRMIGVLVLPSVVAYSLFLFLAIKTGIASGSSADSYDPESIPDRPRIWILPATEWAVYITTFIWFLGIALMELRV